MRGLARADAQPRQAISAASSGFTQTTPFLPIRAPAGLKP